MKKIGTLTIIVLMAAWLIYLNWPKGTVQILGVDNSGVGLPPPPCPNCLTVESGARPAIGTEKIIIAIPQNSLFEMSLACDALLLDKPGSNKLLFLRFKQGNKPTLEFRNTTAWPGNHFQGLIDNINSTSSKRDYIVLIQSDHIMRITKGNMVMTDFNTIAKELNMRDSSNYGFYREKHVNNLNSG
ncbi:MAG TPA: hypothetical protein PKU71_15555, partial [bacterium]|nr:hypothetical protein [bacterium]